MPSSSSRPDPRPSPRDVADAVDELEAIWQLSLVPNVSPVEVIGRFETFAEQLEFDRIQADATDDEVAAALQDLARARVLRAAKADDLWRQDEQLRASELELRSQVETAADELWQQDDQLFDRCLRRLHAQLCNELIDARRDEPSEPARPVPRQRASHARPRRRAAARSPDGSDSDGPGPAGHHRYVAGAR